MGLFSKFSETVFLKQDSELEKRVEALKKLKEKYPNNQDIINDLQFAEAGLKGEKEIEFCLKNANIGMYVLHDINLEIDGLSAQIDYIVITPAKCYLIECKNMIGNITIDNNGQFIREYTINGKKVKKAIESPLRQSERHRDVFLKIVNSNKKGIISKLLFNQTSFENYHKAIAVFANNSGILYNKYAPKEVKQKVIRSDELVNYMKKDIESTERDLRDSQKQMEEYAKKLLGRHVEKEIDYESLYKVDDTICPLCGGKLVERNGKYSKFIGCSNYPKCTFTKKI